MKKQNYTLNLTMLAILIVAVLPNDVFAQNGLEMSKMKSTATEGATFLFTLAKWGLTLVGLIGAGVSGSNIYTKGQGSWQYITQFVVSVLVIIVGFLQHFSKHFRLQKKL